MKQVKQPVFLCGMMGSGKSTIGKILAGELEATFKDLDDLIEKKANMSIPIIFEKLGEDSFREAEKNTLIEESQRNEGILALGGGSLQNQHLVDHVKLQGWLVFLDTPLSTLVERLKNSKNRPLISDKTTQELENQLNRLMRERLPLYSQAHIKINTEGLSKKEIVTAIRKQLTNYEQ